MALLMAALHPERVRGLVLYGGYARRSPAPDYPWAQTAEEREGLHRSGWSRRGTGRPTSGGAARRGTGDGAWWQRRMGAAATPTTVRTLMEMNSLVDVRDVLPTISVPTLLLHRTGDAMLDFRGSVYISERVPGAVLRLLDGGDHLPWSDADQVLDEVEPFVRSLPERQPHRALAAVVAVSGPSAEAVRQHLVVSGGRLRTRADGTPVVLFDGPATAVRAAEALEELGSVGLAIAEVVVVGGPVAGEGVDRAVALADAAAPGEVLVSETAAVLLAGSGIDLEPAGEATRVS